MKKILPFLMLIAFTNYFAQNNSYRYEQIATEEGLAQNTVFNITQDYLGYTWISTGGGLNKWDGYKMTVYKNIPGDSTSLKASHTYVIHEDKNKDLWIGAGGVLNKYNRKEDNFTRIPIIINETGKKYYGSDSFIEDDNYNFWLGVGNSLISYNYKENKFREFPDTTSGKETKNNDNETKIYAGKNIIYIGDYLGNLIEFNTSTGIYKILKNFGKNIISCLEIDDNNNIWAGSSTAGLFKYNIKDGSVSHYRKGAKNKKLTIPNNSVFKIKKDNQGRIFVGTRSGLLAFNEEKNSFEEINLNSINSNSPGNPIISHIYFDKSENIWLGTDPHGVYKISIGQNRFKHLTKENGVIPDNIVVGMAEDQNNNVWMGIFSGSVLKYNMTTGEKTFYKNQPNNKNSLGGNAVISIYKDSKNDLWFGGAHSFGVNKYDTKNKKLIRFPADNSTNSPPHRLVQAIYEDSNNDIWFGTLTEGLFKYDRRNKNFTCYKADKNTPGKLGTHNVLSILEDSFGNFWIGTGGRGLYKMNRETGEFKNCSQNNMVPENSIYSIFEDSKKNLWLGTYGGLFLYNYKEQSYTKFDESAGLANNQIHCIIEDDYSNLWMSTNNGVSRFNYDKKEFTNFTMNDGLVNNEFAQNSFLKLENGTIIMGGVNGLTYFHPKDFLNDVLSDNSIMLTDFKIFNEEVKLSESRKIDSHISVAKNINLTYEDYFFEFEFASINYVNNKDLQYAYKMEGFDKNWVFTNPSKRYATYTNLDPGNYIFKVTIAQNNVPIEELEASVPVYISPPYYETWWFYILVLLIIASILYSIYRYRINKILELERLRVGIASDLHDDIGATLTKLALKADMIQYGLDTEDKISGLKRISEMSRQAVSTMSDIVWSIDSRNDSFESMINKMKDFAFGVLADKEIKVQFNAESLDESEKAPIALRQNLYLIFKEAINNVAKHSDAKEVIINFTAHDNNFTLSIFDNGTNFKEKEFNVGHGLKNMKMRAEKINANINYEKDNGFIIIVEGKLKR